MKKILVTGATGFIGHHVVSLLAHRHQVIATGAHESKARNKSWYQHVQFVPFNLADYDAAADYYNYFQEPDHIIHLAWEGLPNYQAAFHVDTNLPRHYQFLSNLVKHGAKDLTVTGTCLEYGMQEGALSETMPVFPSNPYANAAIASGQDAFNMSGGEQVRDFLPVERVAEYIVKVAIQEEVTGVINVSSNQPVTVLQFVEEYLFNHSAPLKLNTGVFPYPTYEPMRFWGQNAKLNKILQ
jgi:nucleoside-diphosphate-sugar epimerase